MSQQFSTTLATVASLAVLLGACGGDNSNSGHDGGSAGASGRSGGSESTRGNLDASAERVKEDLAESMKGGKSGKGALDPTVYVNEGNGFTVEEAHVVTVRSTPVYYPGEKPGSVAKEMFIENFGERIGVIQTTTEFRQSGNRLDERIEIRRMYIADGKRHTQITHQRIVADGQVIQEGVTEPVITSDFDPIMDSVESTLMLTGVGKAPFGYTDGGVKEVAGVKCKLWTRKMPPLGEDCVWRGFDLYAANKSEETGKMEPVMTTKLLEQSAKFPEELTRLAEAAE